MKTPMIFAFGAWLEAQCNALGLPSVLMDNLDVAGESLCLSQTSAETIEKEYIDGTRRCQLQVDIIAQGLLESRNNLINYLTQLVYLFNSLTDYEIDDNYRILKATATAPSMQSRTENGYVRYAIAISLKYKEL